jgi:type IV pilus assembly protein PilM
MAKELVGLDIGSHSVKVVGMKMTSKGPLLSFLEAKTIPTDLKESPDPVTQILIAIWSGAGLKETKVNLAFSGEGVFFKRIALPSMPMKELQEAVRWEMKGSLPYPIESARIEFRVLREFVQEGVNKSDIMAAVCPKDLIDRTISVVQQAGLKPTRLTVVPQALSTVLRFSDQIGDGGTIAVADLGARKTGIYFFKGGTLQFSREATPAGTDITQAILEGLGFDGDQGFERAEEIKREWGIVTETKTPERAKISFLMRPVLERLASEIKRSLDYFQNQFHGEPVDRLLLTGGGAHLKNISTYLAESLRLPVETFNPLKEIGAKENQNAVSVLDHDSSAYSVAVGLALPERKGIEFLPDRRRILANLPTEKWGFVLAPLIALLIMLTMVWNVTGHIAAVRKEYDAKMLQLRSLDSLQKRLLILGEKERRIKPEFLQIPSSEPDSIFCGEILRDISRLIPGNVVLKILTLEPKPGRPDGPQATESKRLLLKGFAIGQDVQCLTGVAQFIDQLEQSSFFRNSKLVSAEQTTWHRETGVDFEIVCDVDPGSLSSRKDRATAK